MHIPLSLFLLCGDDLTGVEREDYARNQLIHEVQVEAEVEEVIAGQDHSMLR